MCHDKKYKSTSDIAKGKDGSNRWKKYKPISFGKANEQGVPLYLEDERLQERESNLSSAAGWLS